MDLPINKPVEPKKLKWLHISDIHRECNGLAESEQNEFLWGTKGPSGAATASSQEEGGLNWIIKNNKVDFIIITGDIFNKGCWKKQDINETHQFIKDIYDICSKNGDWKDDDGGSKLKRIIYCPGNHDLDRTAFRKDEREKKYRSDLKFEELISKGYFAGTKETEELLIEIAFRDFHELLNDWTGHEWTSLYYDIVNVITGNINLQVICLNTAILSSIKAANNSTESDLKDARELRTTFQLYDASRDIDNALMCYKKYAEKVKKSNSSGTDDGRIVFINKESFNTLTQKCSIARKDAALVIGHHPSSWFHPESKQILLNLLHTTASRLYLSGHVHIPSSDDPIIAEKGNDKTREITTGATRCADGNYGSYGVTIGDAKIENNRVHVKFKKFHHQKTPFGYTWLVHENTYDLGTSLSPRNNSDEGDQNKTESTDKTTQKPLADTKGNAFDHDADINGVKFMSNEIIKEDKL